jgi:type I restriction enzyme M protein
MSDGRHTTLPLFEQDDDSSVQQPDQAAGSVVESLDENEIIDFITGRVVKSKGNEEVRQRIARALYVEYGISLDDMERDFPIPIEVEGRRRGTKRADIAVFVPGTPHTLENVERVVLCKPEPKGSRAVTKIRTHDQAKNDLAELEDLLGTPLTPHVRYGMWTNGLDFFFLYRESATFGVRLEPRADWPIDATDGAGGGLGSAARLRRGEAAMLKTAFRRCHNYVHGNEGLPKDAAFWQFLYLIFAKIHDERYTERHSTQPRFYALAHEPFNDKGRAAIQSRVLALFEEVKDKDDHSIFTARDEITLSPRALAFIVGELASYDLSHTDIDVKGIAYQELVGINLRGDRGQYFTPKGAVELMVRMLNPGEHQVVLDPACGTGGFLREVLRHRLNSWRDAEGTTGHSDTREQLVEHEDRLAEYAENYLFGADFDPFLVRVSQMSIMMATGEPGNVFHLDSLAYPNGQHRQGIDQVRKNVDLGKVDVLMTNPPFGTDIKVEDEQILESYRTGVAQPWVRNRETGQVEVSPTGRVVAMSPEQLFIQRAVEWVKPSGKIGIVLPNGILSNPGHADEGVRRWILENCWVLASVELPVETFVVDANVNILTSLLFLKKKTERERMAAMLGEQQDYPVFMAVAEKVGFDRRGNKIHKRHPDGREILEERRHTVATRRSDGGPPIEFVRMEKVVDNDLPAIAEAYEAFCARYPEPGETT